MKKIALIGATGFVGSHILHELVDRGHQVTAFARSADKIPVKNGNPKTIEIDVTDANKLADALKGNDVIVSAFNAGWANPNLYDDFIKGSQAIQEAAKKAAISRYLVVGGAGSLYVDGKQIVDDSKFPEQYRAGATAARDYLNILKKETQLDWTFLSPALDMYPGKRTGKYRIGTESPVFNQSGNSEISVQDLAVAIVDELENHEFSRRRFTIGY